jgi:hypothetical protein
MQRLVNGQAMFLDSVHPDAPSLRHLWFLRARTA